MSKRRCAPETSLGWLDKGDEPKLTSRALRLQLRNLKKESASTSQEAARDDEGCVADRTRSKSLWTTQQPLVKNSHNFTSWESQLSTADGSRSVFSSFTFSSSKKRAQHLPMIPEEDTRGAKVDTLSLKHQAGGQARFRVVKEQDLSFAEALST